MPFARPGFKVLVCQLFYTIKKIFLFYIYNIERIIYSLSTISSPLDNFFGIVIHNAVRHTMTKPLFSDKIVKQNTIHDSFTAYFSQVINKIYTIYPQVVHSDLFTT